MQNRSHKAVELLEIRLFGVPAFLRADGEPAALPGRKDRALLAYLAAHPDVALARDRLVELIWPDAVEGAGRASLRQSLSTIRKALGQEAGSLIVADRDTVTLRDAGLVTDVAALEALASNPGADDAALPDIEGGFLEGLTGISPGFDTWRATEQARLSALISKHILELADKAEAERRFADARALLTRALGIDPLAESVHRRLMRIHAAEGRADAALRQFRALEVMLETELGVRPEKETLELARDIRIRRQGRNPPVAAPPTEEELGASIGNAAVLVVPFVESGNAEDYFAGSFTESVIIALARFHETPVLDLKTTRIAATVHGEDPAEMAVALGTSYALTGIIRRTDARLRINAKLTDVASGRTVWAESYDRDIGDIFEVEDDLSARVAAAIAGRIEEEERRRAQSKRPADLELVDLVMRGRHELNKFTNAGENAAQAYFKAALERDPDCVPALAGLAVSYLHEFEGTSTNDPDRKLADAQRLAERAVALDEDDAHARYALASAVYYRGGTDLAIQHCNRALEHNPNDYHNLCSQGWFLTFNGNLDEGLAATARAISLNPYAPNGCLIVVGFGKIVRGDAEGAIRTLTAIRSENIFKQGALAACYTLLGRERESELAAQAFRHLAETDFPGDAETGFARTRSYWRRMFYFARAEDNARFFGALNRAGVPV